nr:hypothetical protein [Tanacetum cinerariifolium]GEY78363.1 hypothetical protein [Tanacetum cinerariifolium]
MDNSVSNQSALIFYQYFELNELKAQSQEKDTVIRKLKERIKSLSRNMNKDKVKKDIKEIETINIELDHMVSKLMAENENLKQTYKQLYDSIKPTRIRSKEQCDALINQVKQKSVEIFDLNVSLQEKDLVITALKDDLRKLKGKALVDDTVTTHTIAPEMLKVDVEPIALDLVEITIDDAGTLTTIIPGPVTIEEKAKKKNDVKARSMLLMVLPNENLVTFNQYKDAKTMFAAIETRFGFKDLDYPDKVYKVEKALYGLHQAPRAWYETLAKYLLDNGFRKGKIDQTMFIKRQKEDILLAQVYVDDIIFGSTKKELCTEFEKSDGIFISQDKYVDEILRKFKYADVKPAKIC